MKKRERERIMTCYPARILGTRSGVPCSSHSPSSPLPPSLANREGYEAVGRRNAPYFSATHHPVQIFEVQTQWWLLLWEYAGPDMSCLHIIINEPESNLPSFLCHAKCENECVEILLSVFTRTLLFLFFSPFRIPSEASQIYPQLPVIIPFVIRV